MEQRERLAETGEREGEGEGGRVTIAKKNGQIRYVCEYVGMRMDAREREREQDGRTDGPRICVLCICRCRCG